MLMDVMGTVFQQCLRRLARAESSFCIAVPGWRGRVVQGCVVTGRCEEKLLHLCKSQSMPVHAAP